MGNKVTLKARVEGRDWMDDDIRFEFGRVQAEMSMSAKGNAARALKLKAKDKVKVTIEKIGR